MRKILLYGELGNRFGKEHFLNVHTASEAVQAMCVNYPEFKKMLRDAHKYGVGFKVFVGGMSLKSESETQLPSSNKDVIRIAPAIFGSGGLGRILIGAVLIVASVLTFGAAAPGSFAAYVGSAVTSIGVSLALSGIFQLLSNPPKPDNGLGSDQNGQSFIFSGPENVTRQGGAVPLGYGRMMVGSTVVSAGIEDSDQ